MRKNLQDLAAVIKTMSEYQDMLAKRKKLLMTPQLGSKLQSFEREHARILGAGVSEQDIETRLQKLYADYKPFLDHEDVKLYIKATQRYQDMISSGMRYLNELLDLSHAR